MTFSRVWANGVASMPISSKGTPQLNAADLAAIDSNEQCALDKTWNGCLMGGTITLAAGAAITLASPTASFQANGACRTATGGRFQCGNGDFPQVSPALTPTPVVPFSEFFSNAEFARGGPGYGGLQYPVPDIVLAQIQFHWWADPSGSLASTNINANTPNDTLLVPLTRLHDGATLTEVIPSFLVSSSRTELPTRYPAVSVWQFDPFLQVMTNLSGWSFFVNAGGTLSSYKNAGSPNTWNISFSATVDVGQYLYFLALLDEDYGTLGGSPESVLAPNEWLGFSTTSSTSSLRFS